MAWPNEAIQRERPQVFGCLKAQCAYNASWLFVRGVAEYSLLLGAKRKDVPPGIGTLLEVLARYGLTARG